MKNEAIPFGNSIMCPQLKSQTQTETVLFTFDTGCTHSLIPAEVTQSCHLRIENIIKDNIKIKNIQWREIEVKGKTTDNVTLDSMDKKFYIEALIAVGLNSSEVVVSQQTIIDW